MRSITKCEALQILDARASVVNDYDVTESPVFFVEDDLEHIRKIVDDTCGALVTDLPAHWLAACCGGRTVLTNLDVDLQVLRQFAPKECPVSGLPCPRAQLMRELVLRHLYEAAYKPHDTRLSVELLKHIPKQK